MPDETLREKLVEHLFLFTCPDEDWQYVTPLGGERWYAEVDALMPIIRAHAAGVASTCENGWGPHGVRKSIVEALERME